ncbi:MAG: hypothetical protein ABSA79_09110 [Candidatus Bathyarchaeia archaeon]
MEDKNQPQTQNQQKNPQANTNISEQPPTIDIDWVRFPFDDAANIRKALTKPKAFVVYGGTGEGKSSLVENIGNRYGTVIDAFGSRDNEGLAWCRSPRADSILFLKGESVTINSKWPSINAKDLTLKELSSYKAVISVSAFYSSIQEEWKCLALLMNKFWNRLSWTEPWALVIREAANLLYSRESIGDSQTQAKNYMIHVIREMRHVGFALVLDSVRWFSIDIDVRSIADYTFLKGQGIEGLPDSLHFLYNFFDPYGVMRMGVEKFIIVSRKGPVGYGESTMPYWHKLENENLLKIFNIDVKYDGLQETGEKASSHVGDYEHVNIIQTRFETQESMEKVAEKLCRSSRTVYKHITYHNMTIQSFKECDKCARVKSLLSKQLISNEPAPQQTSNLASLSNIQNLNIKPQQAISSITSKKDIAELYRFQGLRVTESYEATEPHLVVWKDATTPQEVIHVKSILPPQTVDIQLECKNEVTFAQKYGFNQIHLICVNSFTGQKEFDSNVNFTEKIEIGGSNNQKLQPLKSDSTEIDPGEKQYNLTLNLKIAASPVEITDRVMAVSEAFGVGVDDKKEFMIFDNVQVKFNPDDLLYVTGDSGSGKSTFLKLFSKETQSNNLKCINFADIQPDENEVVINSIGASQEEAMALLSIVGLSEAFIMLRKYKELSEGQKYRYKLAKMISQNADVLLIDEFGATLDREMAKVLAFCIQKWARRNKKMVIVATTHKDLIEDFNPNIVVDKKFGQTTQVKYYPAKPRQFSLVNSMQILPATKEDYEYLKCFHYLQGTPAAVKYRFKLTYNGETIGIILYAISFRALHLRNERFPEYKNNIKRVNAEILRIARIIIHPKFRGISLAQELVKQTLPKVNARVVETVAVMAKYNPFFEKAGMTFSGKMELQPIQKKLLAFIEGTGGKISLIHNKALCKGFLNSLNSSQMAELEKILRQDISDLGGSSPGRMETLQKKLDGGDFIGTLIDSLPVQRCYLYWLNQICQPEQNHTPTQPDQDPSSQKV